MTTTNAAICVKEFLAHDPSEWESMFPHYAQSVNDMAYAADKLTEKAALLEGYLSARGANGTGDAGHEEGIQAGLKQKSRVRKALGYNS